MKPPCFDYLAPQTIDEVLETLAAEGQDASIMAGGQSLIAMLNMRLVKPSVVVDVSRIPGCNTITEHGNELHVGATVTQRNLLEHARLMEINPLLAKALPWVGHFQTRSKGTVCGSIAHADPSSEIPLCLAVLKGEVELRSSKGKRVVPARDFQIGMLSTDRNADEMIVAARFPNSQSIKGSAFNEFSFRHGDFAIVAVAVVVTETIRIGIGGMTDRPEVRELPMLSGDALADALNDLAWELQGTDDQHASARYRRDLLRNLGKRTVEEALQCHV